MVNFGKQLLAQQEPQWKDSYIRYKYLKQILKKYLDSSAPDFNNDYLINSADPLFVAEGGDVASTFRSALDEDLDNFSQLFHSTHEHLWHMLQSLSEQISDIQDMTPSQQADFLEPVRGSLLQLSRKLLQLQTYVVLNYTALSKICKKHDKLCHPYPTIKTEVLGCEKLLRVLGGAGVEADHGRIVGTHHHTEGTVLRNLGSHAPPPCLDSLIETTEQHFADLFENGNIADARITLFSHITKYSSSGFHRYRVGMQMGMSLMLLFLLLGLITVDNNSWAEDPVRIGKFKDTLPIFACFSLLTCVLWMWALDVHVWSRARVNFVFLLDLDPRTRLVTTQLLDEASKLSIILLVLYCCYIGHISGRLTLWGVSDVVFPLSLAIFFLLKMVWPFNFPFGHWNTRKWVWKALWRFVTSPFSSVRFHDVFFGDVICSLVITLTNLQYTLCYFTSGAFEKTASDASFGSLQCRTLWGVVPVVVSVLPLWLRFCQCLRRYYDTRRRFPNLANALKFALTQVVSLFGAFHPAPQGEWPLPRVVWLVFIIISTAYTFWWDVYQDWSLLRRRSKHRFLRDELMFSRHWCYYAVIPFDLCFRFVFMLTIIPYNANPLWTFDRQTFVSLLLPILFGLLELVRRGVWAIFRVENEHINNKEGFREIKAVPHVVDPHAHDHVKTGIKLKGSARLWGELAAAFVVLVSVSVACYYILRETTS